MKGFIQRSVTAIVFAGILISLIYYSLDSFLVLLTLILIGSYVELSKLFEKSQLKLNKRDVLLKTIFLFLLSIYPVFVGVYGSEIFVKMRILFVLLIFIFFGIEFLFQPVISKSVYEALFLLYLFLWFHSALNIFYFHRQMQYSNIFVLSVILMIWANDTFAYITGMLIGKHKLMPGISPKKTIEGFVGGVVFTGMTAFLCHRFLLRNDSIISVVDVIIIGLLISVFGTIGDLIESKLKRMADVKDSGHLLPGHGGVLDRFDAWFVALPAVDMYFILKDIFI